MKLKSGCVDGEDVKMQDLDVQSDEIKMQEKMRVEEGNDGQVTSKRSRCIGR